MKAILEITTKNFKGENQNVILISRIKRKNLKSFIELQDKVLYRWVEENLAVGNIIQDDAGWDLLCKIAALVPTLDEQGNESPLDLNVLEEVDFDIYNNITRLFFTASIDDDDYNNTEIPYRPSLLAEFNQLNHGGALNEQVKKVRENREMEEKAAQQATKTTKTEK